MQQKKVMAAMSGGVDSAVTALLLLEQGYQVTGITLKLFDNEDIVVSCSTKTCCTAADAADARDVADRLGFPHYTLSLRDRFRIDVINRFVSTYLSGETPNPCIDCNRYIKFDELLKRANLLGFDYIATGHYANVEYNSTAGRYLLKRAVDQSKDQTYVLYGLTQEQLSKTLFPLGNLRKTEVRKIAADKGLQIASKPDSQDICFVKNGSYATFIEDYTGERMPGGDFVNTQGNSIGKHQGIAHYTIGQRKKLGLSFDMPMYVVAKNKENHTVTLGREENLYEKKLTASDVNLIAVDKLTSPLRVTVKTRYKQDEAAALLHPLTDNKVLVEFEKPQKAITPGQAAVFYDGDIIVGGGTII